MLLVLRHQQTTAQEGEAFEDYHHILLTAILVADCHSALRAHMRRWVVVAVSNPLYPSEVYLVLWAMLVPARCVELQLEGVSKVFDRD